MSSFHFGTIPANEDIMKLLLKSISITVLSLFLLQPLIAEEESDISHVDIIEILDDINQKLDKLSRRPENQLADKLDFGIIPGTFRIFPDITPLNNYADSYGDYDRYLPVFFPFYNGIEFFLDFKAYPFLSFGIDYCTYRASTIGIMTNMTVMDAAIASDAEYVSDIDADARNDYFGGLAYYFQSVDITAQGHYELNDFLTFNGGIRLGFGEEIIAIQNSGTSVFTGFFALGERETSWQRLFILTGALAGIKMDFGVFDFFVEGGFDYHWSLKGWNPSPGINQYDPAPPDYFNSMNFRLRLGPSLTL